MTPRSTIVQLSLAAGLLLTLSPRATAQLTPNLKAQSLTFNSYSWIAGKSYSFTATWKNTVLLLGNAGAHYSALYFSTNSTISTGDTLIRSAYLSGLKSGATATWKSTVTAPTVNTTNGTKYVGLYVDYKGNVKETSESDNTYARSISYRSGSDLYVNGWSFPSSARAGSTATVGASVYNYGSLSASAFYTAFFLSTNSVISHSDHYLGSFYTSSLAANTSTGVKKYNYRLPNLPTYGTYYFGIEVDSTAKIAEKSESNNTKAVATTILAPLSSTRALEYQSIYQTASKPTYMSRSQMLAIGYASVGGYVNMRVTAPAMAGGLQLCVWSFKSPWAYDVASSFSLSLVNNPGLFPGWFSTLNAQGQATPQFRLPKGAPISGTLSVYTQAFLFNKAFKLAGTTNAVRTVIYK